MGLRAGDRTPARSFQWGPTIPSEQDGAVAILHDLTNCLRNGDLTVLHGEWPAFAVGFREVKAGGPERHVARQERRLRERIRVLRTSRGTHDRGPYSLHRLPTPYRTHLAALRDVVSGARRTGFASAQPEDCVVVSAVGRGRLGDREVELGDWRNHAASARGWTPADDRHFAESSLVRRLLTHRRPGRQAGYIAPVAIFPLPAEDIVDILLGRIEYSVTLRAEVLEARFAARGIAARCAGRDEWDKHFLVAERGGHTVVVPTDARKQMLLELMTSATLAEVVELMFDALDAGTPAHEQHVLC